MYRSIRLFTVVFALVFAFSACSEDERDPLPDGTLPNIVRTAPVPAAILVKPDTIVQLRYLLADNEQLASWSLRLRNAVSSYDTILVNREISGTQQEVAYSFNVADTFPDGITTLRFTAYVNDLDGNRDSTDFTLQVNTPLTDTCQAPPQYRMLDYTRPDTIYSGVHSNPARAGFSLIQRAQAVGNADTDLQEISSVPGAFQARLRSVNNNNAPVFLVFKSDVFSYPAANWCSIYQAFLTHTAVAVTPTLEVGDIVLVDLALVDPITPEKPHYAILRIVNVEDNPGNDADRIVFTYKRTNNN